MQNRLYIFDTTLRDGEQVPGCQLNTVEKIEVARALEALGVDVIEAGFPISSPGDFHSVEEISKVLKEPVICGLTRAVEKDIDVAADALRYARRKRIHTGIGTSPYHIRYKFNSTPEEIIERAVFAVKYAKKYVEDVEFYAEDAGRTDNEYLARVIEAVIKAGATVVNIPVSGVIHGARQVEVTINGIGERAGNTSLEEVVMIMKSRKHLGIETGIRSQNIYKTSRMVSSLMNMPVQPNKAIVGRNAFAHSSGIHQDGVLKHRENYEIIDPVDVGISESIIALTARSGRAALRHRLQNLGYSLDGEDLQAIYEKFLEVADRKKEVKDEDLELLVGNSQHANGKAIHLRHLQVIAGKSAIPMAAVTLDINGELFTATEAGNGPVDAVFKAIRSLVRHNVVLDEFLVQAITRGSDDLGKVHITVENRGNLYYGFAGNTDILTASAEAFINAINKIV